MSRIFNTGEAICIRELLSAIEVLRNNIPLNSREQKNYEESINKVKEMLKNSSCI